MKKHTILFLAANPGGTDRLALDREARAIQEELERSGARDCFELETRWAAEPLDLLRELRKLRPTVVHFSGHGIQPGQHVENDHPPDARPRRDVSKPVDPGGEPAGLLFHGAGDRAQVVSTAALERTIDAAGSSVKLVVLSACYSAAHAAALLAHVDCVVGMSGSILDEAARSFAIGFYGGLGERESVAAAFKQGCAAIGLEGMREADRPQLKVRDGVDAGQLVLAESLTRGGNLDGDPGSTAGGLAGSQQKPGPARRRRLLLATGAVPLLLATFLLLSAGARRTACLVPGLRSACAAVGIGDVPTPAEQALWNEALAQDSCDGLRTYLRTYPRGIHADEARSRLDGRWTEERLEPEKDERLAPLVIKPDRPFPTKAEAQRDAQERGDQEAARMCDSPGVESLVKLLSARVELGDWDCSQVTDGFTCGTEGEIICRVQNRIKSERCRQRP